MNVLLIYPEFPDTFWSFKHALKFVHKKASSPPLGLLTVAALLPSDWSKQLLDLNVTKLTRKALEWADYAFVSGMILQRDAARRIIAQCKEMGVKTVAGGPLFSADHTGFPEVDHLVLNEAEITLPEFLRDLEQGCPKRIYATTEFPDISKTPTPLWDLVDMSKYASMSIQFSRGCPYHCDFCNVTSLFGHRCRIKTVQQVLTELDTIYAMGWRDSIFFVDDNFIGNKGFLKKELLPALIQWQKGKAGITFHTEASINLADDEPLMNMMAEAGFDQVFIGIETPDDSSLAECSKKQNQNRDLLADVKRIQKARLQVQGGFIVGFDNDTPAIFQKQIDFIQNSGIVTAMVGLLQASPGTRLYERLKQEGRLSGDASGDNVNGTTNIIPKMDIETLLEGYKALLKNIYSPKQYYLRVKTFLRNYEPPRFEAPLTRTRFMAFLRSVLRLGVFGKERFQYWNLVLWTGIRRPRLLPLAITMSIYGHHYRRICELYLR